MGDFGTFAIEEAILPQRYTEFHFFVSGGADGAISANCIPGVPWKLKEIKVHLSTIFLSTEDLVILLSSAKGSYYDQTLLSEAMSGYDDAFLIYDPVKEFLSDDTLTATISMVSGVYTVGIELVCWGALG